MVERQYRRPTVAVPGSPAGLPSAGKPTRVPYDAAVAASSVKPPMTMLRAAATSRPVGRLVLAPVVRWGYGAYLRSDTTPTVAYSCMRKLFQADPGSFDRLAERARRERSLPTVAGGPGALAHRVDEALAQLRAEGFYVLPDRLPEPELEALTDVARQGVCNLIEPFPGAPATTRFDPDAPQAVRYELDEADVMNAGPAQRLVADRSLLELAQRYLEATPVQDLVAMWWSVPGRGEASSAAAQQFHFDLDRLSFLKVFVYLTDVGPDNGPHVFARGSHRQLPDALRADRRFGDDEVERWFPRRQVSIDGPRGTVFVADTRGLHKGLALRAGHRLVFQLQFSSSLYGAPYRRLTVRDPVPELAAACQAFPPTYRRFDLGAT